MPSVLDNLNTAYAQLAQRLVDITAAPKPNYSLDGESYSWAEYQTLLIDKMLATEQAIQRASGPFQITTRVRT